ncbi:hypothetical protein GQ457_06G016580 [Hibiscus cannabinus]
MIEIRLRSTVAQLGSMVARLGSTMVASFGVVINIPSHGRRAYQQKSRIEVKDKDLKPKRIKDYLECKISQRKGSFKLWVESFEGVQGFLLSLEKGKNSRVNWFKILSGEAKVVELNNWYQSEAQSRGLTPY